ncbi:MAG: TetR/AcrR family transcriptional regulator, partial [Anaerolineae bacterium]|nr:TetR/AcrR family transcriptional regulator [Anaerolineae bacterium]
MTDTPKTTRRMPQQERSRRRYQHILDTAAKLFAEEGIASVTTNHIAAAAEVSIGSLYQFFPNKEALLEALTERYIEQMAAVFPQEMDIAIPVEAFIEEIITQFVRFEGQEDGFRVILLHMESSAATEAAASLHKMLVTQIDR